MEVDEEKHQSSSSASSPLPSSFLQRVQSQPEQLKAFRDQLVKVIVQHFQNRIPTHSSFFKDKFLSSLESEVVEIPFTLEISKDIQPDDKTLQFSLSLDELRWENSDQHFPALAQNKGAILDVMLGTVTNGSPVLVGLRSTFATKLIPNSPQAEMDRKSYLRILQPHEKQQQTNPAGAQHIVPKATYEDRLRFLTEMGFFTEVKDFESGCLLITSNEIPGLTETLVLIPIVSKLMDYLQEFDSPEDPVIDLEFDDQHGPVYGLVSEKLCQRVFRESEAVRESFRYLRSLTTQLNRIDFELVPLDGRTLAPDASGFLAAHRKATGEMETDDNVIASIPFSFQLELTVVCYLPRGAVPMDIKRFVPSNKFRILHSSERNQYYLDALESPIANAKPVLIEPWRRPSAGPALVVHQQSDAMDIDDPQ